ncbi:MAG: hypothetical protein LBG66_02690 [Gallionellaceae bacterium]|nr:hypothetical protein [Gallionellaceae bacterium]
MEPINTDGQLAAKRAETDVSALMAEYGIAFDGKMYECGGYSYYKLEEAVAYAKSLRSAPSVVPDAGAKGATPVGLTQRQIIGLLGCAVLAVGVFMPLISGPFGQSVNYFANGSGDGVFILGATVISIVLVFVRRYRFLWVTGGFSLALLAYTYWRMQTTMVSAKSQIADVAQDPVLHNFANAFSDSIQMQWGWAVLAVGVVLILVCAAMKGR